MYYTTHLNLSESCLLENFQGEQIPTPPADETR